MTNVPSSLILDTAGAVKSMMSFIDHPMDTPWLFFKLQVLEDIVDCVRNVKTYPRELRQLMEDIDAGKYKNHCPQASDGRFAAAVQITAATIFEQLKAAGAFMPDGVLPYYFYPVHDRHFNDLLLLHLHGLPKDA